MPKRDHYESSRYGIPKDAHLDKRTGFYDEWHDPRGGRYFFGRGTDPWSPVQVGEDLEQVIGITPKRFKQMDKEADRYAQQYPDAHFSGYSRGGREAARHGGVEYGGFDVGVNRSKGTRREWDDQGGVTGAFHNTVVAGSSNLYQGARDVVEGIEDFFEGDDEPTRPYEPSEYHGQRRNFGPTEPEETNSELELGESDYGLHLDLDTDEDQGEEDMPPMDVDVRNLGEFDTGTIGDFKRPREHPNRSLYLKLGYQGEFLSDGTHSSGKTTGYVGMKSLVEGEMKFACAFALARKLTNRFKPRYPFTPIMGQVDLAFPTNISLAGGEGSRVWDVQTLIDTQELNFEIVNPDGTTQGVVCSVKLTKTPTVNVNSNNRGFGTIPYKSINELALDWESELFEKTNIIDSKTSVVAMELKDIHSQYLLCYDQPNNAWSVESHGAKTVSHPLRDVLLKCYSTHEILVQNITPADSTNDATDHKSLLHLEKNPIHGYLYHFDGRVPVVHNNYGGNNGTYDSRGLFLEDSSYWGVGSKGNGFLVPPDGNLFLNCDRYAYVRMPPGSIKRFTLRFTFDGPIVNLIRGLNRGDSVHDYHDGLGTSCMFGLHKAVKTGDDDGVVLNYQTRRYHGAVVKGIRYQDYMPEKKIVETNN